MQTRGSLLHLHGISKSVGFGCNFSVKNQTGYAVQHSCNYQKVARSGYETKSLVRSLNHASDRTIAYAIAICARDRLLGVRFSN